MIIYYLYAIYLVCVHSTSFHVVYRMALKIDVKEIISQIVANTTIKNDGCYWRGCKGILTLSGMGED